MFFEEYIKFHWKPELPFHCTRGNVMGAEVPMIRACGCQSCEHYRQLKREWDANQAQAEEFERHLREGRRKQHDG